MHFVTGGACQGKRKWVNHYYDLENKGEILYWGCGYDDNFKSPNELTSEAIVVLEGIDEFIKRHLKEKNELDQSYFQTFFESWLKWEQANKTMIIIGNDIGKGIVPIDPFERQWRDLVGWCYQDISNMASRVDIIWAGLNQTIKEC